MTKNTSKKRHVDDLRQQAEKRIPKPADRIGETSEIEVKKLIHELEVHQIELEMQNEELRKAQIEATEARQKYADLYDFAPVGYFTFDRRGHIIEANITGASLLGAEKRSLAKQPFQRFIIPGYFSIFQSHLQKAHESRSKQSCELKLTGKDGSLFDALIDTIAVIDGEDKFDHYRSSVTDITERMRTEEALRQSEERSRAIANYTYDWENWVGSDGKLIWVNPGVFHFTGYSVNECLAMSDFPLSLIDEVDREKMAEHFTAAVQGASANDVEFRMWCKDGGLKWAAVSYQPIYDSNGASMGHRSSVRDITERKRAEEALREAEEGYRALAATVDSMYLVDRECRYQFMNDAHLLRLGVSLDQVKGRSYGDFHSEEDLKQFAATIEAVFETGKSFQAEHKGRIGDSFFLRTFSPVRYPRGSITAVTVISKDITERRQAEEAMKKSDQLLRYAGEMAKVGGWELDLSIEEVSWTEEVGRIHGVEPGYKPKLEEAIKFYAPESIPALKATLKKTIETGEPYDLESLIIPLGSKDKIWVRSLGRAVYSDGKIVKIAGTFQDIDKYKRAEEKLRESEENFRRSMDDSPLGVRIVTVEGETIYANRAILDIYGYDSIEELRATPAVKRYTPESFAEFQTRREKRKRGDYEPSEYEISIVRKDGEVRHLHVFRKEVLWDGERQFQVLHNDITDRKQAENALILSEYRFKELFENMSSSVAVYEAAADGEDFIFTNFNKAAEETERIDRKDVIGKSIFDVFPGIRNMGLFEVFQRVWRTGRPEHVPVSLYRDKRTEGWRENYIYKLPTGEIVTIYNDVTARKKAEDALRESEARFANIFNASPVAIAITRLKDNRLIDVNNAWQKVTGYSQGEVIDRTPFELNTWVNPGERDQLISIMREQGTVRNFLFQLRHKSGTVLDMLMSAELIELAGERYMLSLAQDITERKRAEESLKESEEKYRALVETTDTGFVIVDENGTVLDANENYIRMTGHKALDEIRNRSITEWTSRHDLERNEQAVRECFDQGFIRDLEISYVNKKGENTPVDINASVVETKEGRKIISLCRDITERKRAEERMHESEVRYRMLFENAADGIALADTETGQLVDCNQGLSRMVEWNRAELVGQAQSILHPPAAVIERFSQTFQQHQTLDPGIALEDLLLSKSGKLIPVEIRAARIEINGRDFLMGIFRDITERKLAEEAIKVSHQQLRALAGRLQSVREDQRKQIAREIHDELGGALTGLKIDLSFLASSAPKSRDKTKRDLFLSQIREMTKLIDETIGTVRRLVTELRPSILDDFGLLAALEWQIHEFEKRTGIQCEFVSTLEYISLDEEFSTAVFRIFQESLTNVARHANATKVTATLYKEADSLVLKMEDNGRGISEDDIHNAKSLGLIGMRERALFLRGTVNFSGRPDRGTTVSLQFPFES